VAIGCAARIALPGWWNTAPRYTRPGTYYHEQRVDSFESHYGKNWRFDQPIYECQLFVIDDNRGVVCNYFENRGVPLEKYLPLTVRFTAYAVAAGHSFVKPDFWDEKHTGFDQEMGGNKPRKRLKSSQKSSPPAARSFRRTMSTASARETRRPK